MRPTASSPSPRPSSPKMGESLPDSYHSPDDDPLVVIVKDINRSRHPSVEENTVHWTGFWSTVKEKRNKTAENAPRRKKWSVIAFGQIVAFAAAGMNVTSYTLSNHYNIQVQLFQLFWVYAFLSLHLCYQKPLVSSEASHFYFLPGTRLRLRVAWYIYAMMSVLDLIPNYFQLISFRFTSLTSTTLLGSLTIPSTMLFSSILLGKRFSRYHYLGVCLCIAGGIMTGWIDAADVGGNPTSAMNSSSSFTSLTSPEKMMNLTASTLLLASSSSSSSSSTVWIEQPPKASHESDADLKNPSSSSPSAAYVGDVLAIAAALLYGLGDSVSEFSIKHIDRQEYLGMIGIFGMMSTGVTFPTLEGVAVLHLWRTATLQQWLLLCLYIFFVLFYYIAASWFYTSSDATLLNLSLLTANLWVIWVSVLVGQNIPPPLFYMAALLVAIGVVIYQQPLQTACSETQQGDVHPFNDEQSTSTFIMGSNCVMCQNNDYRYNYNSI